MAGNGNGNTKGIAGRVQAGNGIAKVTLGELRDELGHARLGKTVLEKMGEHLHEQGFGYFPNILDAGLNPVPRQWQEVHIYVQDGSPRAAILDAVSDPETHDLAAAFEMFTEAAPNFGKMSEKQRLAMVRAVVCAGDN